MVQPAARVITGLRKRDQGMGRDVGDEVRAGGGAELVVDDAQDITAPGQLKYRAEEVAAARGVDPGGANDQCARAGGGHRLIAGELAPAVGGESGAGVSVSVHGRVPAPE